MTRLTIFTTFAVLTAICGQISAQMFPNMGGQGMGRGQGLLGGLRGGLGGGLAGAMGGALGRGLGGLGGLGQPGMRQPFNGGWSPNRGGGWGQAGNGFDPMNLMGRQRPRRQNRYQTCIGKNTNGDEMRITLSVTDRPPWLRQLRVSDNFVRLYADYKSPAGTLQGQYQLVVTEFSRVEDGCSSQALGDILAQPSPVWWDRSPTTPRGILGSPVTISRGQNAMSSEIIENLNFDDFIGRGIAMCPSRQVRGNRCQDLITLCCKIGRDQQSASQAVRPARPMFGMQQQMGMGMNQNQGLQINNGMGNQMNNGLNSPMGNGLNGLNGATNPSGNNQMGNTLAQSGSIF